MLWHEHTGHQHMRIVYKQVLKNLSNIIRALIKSNHKFTHSKNLYLGSSKFQWLVLGMQYKLYEVVYAELGVVTH